jgi:hypothetical protein
MEHEKKEFVIDKIVHVFDLYLQQEDRIAMVRFN